MYNDSDIYNIADSQFMQAVKVVTTNETVFSGNLSQYIATVYL